MKGKSWKNGMKIGAMALMLLLLVGGFVAVTTAKQNGEKEDYTAEFLEEAIKEVTPFISISNEYIATFDVEQAKKEGVSQKHIKTGQELVDITNELATIYRSPETEQSKQKLQEIDQKLKKFEPFFLKVATKGYNTTSQGDAVGILQTACGGDRNSPHTCPPRVNSGVYRSTLQGIKDYLVSQGYHQTAWYACGSSPLYPCEYDYTKVVNAYSCPNGPFRNQANIYQSGSQWTYSYQTPEPNPEIFTYVWPAWWWGDYVRWWHRYYC